MQQIFTVILYAGNDGSGTYCTCSGFLHYRSAESENNIPALVMIYVAFSLPFSILVVTNFMKGVNRSLEEAALIDGATYFQIYKM